MFKGRAWLKLVNCSRTRLGEPCLKTYPLECEDLLRRSRVAFQAGRTLKENIRLAQLEAVVRMLEEHECDFVDALGRDLHKVTPDTVSCCVYICHSRVMFVTVKIIDSPNVYFSSWFICLHAILFDQPRFETVMSELVVVKNEALYAISNLKKWMQPQPVERNLVRLLFVIS